MSDKKLNPVGGGGCVPPSQSQEDPGQRTHREKMEAETRLFHAIARKVELDNDEREPAGCVGPDGPFMADCPPVAVTPFSCDGEGRPFSDDPPKPLGGGMTFGRALEEMVHYSKRVARVGWNGKGMWLELADVYIHPKPRPGLVMQPFISMKTADNALVPWAPSQTDMLAEDWMIVGEETEI